MNVKCRSCLTSSLSFQYYSLLTVFPEFSRSSLSVLDLLSKVTSTEVILSSNLPSKICSPCFKSLKLVYSFIVAFKHSQKILLQSISIEQNENINITTEEHDNKDDDQNLELNEEKIIIITEEENEDDNEGENLDQTDNYSNFDETEATENDKIESSELQEILEDTSSEVTIADPADNIDEEIELSEDNDLEEKDEFPIKCEEKSVIFDDEVDQEIIAMEETTLEQTDTESNTNKPEDSTRVAQCEYCENEYSAPKHLLVHIKSKHPERLLEYQQKHRGSKMLVKMEPTVYKCEICDKVFYSQRNLRNHKYNFHHPESVKIYKCQLCNEQFKNINALRYHKLAKHKGKHFTCSLCDKKFISPSTLKQHIKGVHEKAVPENYLCSICGRGFKYNTALKYHMGYVHTQQKDFVCGYCGVAFVLVGQLKYHERIHTGERPYSCKYCKKTFKRSPERQKHERIHLGIYPYKCDYCEARVFTSSYNMKVHWLQHAGDYECEVCGKGFASSDILVFHYSHKHKIRDVVNQE